ncbi:hypothetical protein CGCSCA1_v014310 [Colletotrichum siamense]|nr:hypothetical protein CGCSCA1_v014310 [Colletotrichum siamense]
MDALHSIWTPVDLRCSLCSYCAMFALTLSCCQSLICRYCESDGDLNIIASEMSGVRADDSGQAGAQHSHPQENLEVLERVSWRTCAVTHSVRTFKLLSAPYKAKETQTPDALSDPQ